MEAEIVFDVRSGVDPDTREPRVMLGIVTPEDDLAVEISPKAARGLAIVLITSAVTAAYDGVLRTHLQKEGMSVRQIHEFMESLRESLPAIDLAV